MAQIDLCLAQMAKETTLSYQDDFYEMYKFVSNSDLRKLFAIYHTQLNKWFVELNNDMRYEIDEDRRRICKGGYFHAQDSRDFLAVLEAIDRMKTACGTSEYAFEICNDDYASAIKHCRKFVVKSGGSTIPEDFQSIKIADITPIFRIINSISIDHNKHNAEPKNIGEGSYAVVYSYFDPIYRISVVLKRAKKNLDDKELARFKQEFEVLKKLHSPYIVEVYAYNDKSHEYTMERMDENIYDYIRRNNTKLTLANRKKLIHQIVQGLSYMHEKEYLHRDISPWNVFIKHYDDVDVVKIGDFGLVKNPESHLTSLQSELKGSLNDPDLIHVGFANYSMCHEIYALTRLCFFILTGKTNIERQKDGMIKKFWETGTNPDRNKRFHSVRELLEAVKAITDDKV